MKNKTRTISQPQPLRSSPRKSSVTSSRALPNQADKGGEISDNPTKTVCETSSDNGGVENGGHLSPQMVNNCREDSMDLDSLGFGTCIRCNARDDLVLVCSERGCLIAVHEKCMGCNAKFDNLGRFRCPFCEQKLSLARVKEMRRKVMEAKRALSRFLEGSAVDDVGGNDEKDVGDEGKNCNPNRLNDAEGENGAMCLDGDRKEGMENEEPGCRYRSGGDAVGYSGEETRAGIGLVTSVCAEEMQDKASSPESDQFEAVEEEEEEEEEKDEETEELGLVSEEEDEEIVRVDKRVSKKNDDVEDDEEEMQPEALDGTRSENDISETETLVKRPKRFKRRAGRMKNLQNTSLSKKSSTRERAPFLRRKAAAKKNASNFSQKASTRSKFQAVNAISIENFPEEKRKRLQWTEEEEEMLREGVQAYADGNSNLPWRKILEHGRAVFHETRVPGDLKDKWRNMLVRDGIRPKRR